METEQAMVEFDAKRAHYIVPIESLKVDIEANEDLMKVYLNTSVLACKFPFLLDSEKLFNDTFNDLLRFQNKKINRTLLGKKRFIYFRFLTRN